MARPLKQGLDYFPLDVDIDQDDKVQLVEALHGNTGFYVLIKLLMKVYKEGYFYPWAESEQILFSKRVNVDINILNDIVNDCIKYGVFHKGMYEKHKILTSKGIQERFFEASKRRKKIDYVGEYLLIKVENGVNANRNPVNDDINSQADGVSDDISTQRKGKESIGKETINLPLQLFEHYLSKNIMRHHSFTASMKTAANARLKVFSFEQLIEAIDNYATVYKGEEYWFTYKYSFTDLMREKDVLKFINDAEPLNNFSKNKDAKGTLAEHVTTERPKEYVPDFNAGED